MKENYQKLNVIAGWAVFAIATIVYSLTIEPTASFWDCGEFIASAYKLEVGHPPGAPFFMLLARLFSMFGSPETAATSVNMLSALSSSFTILFLFWTITHMAKKLMMLPTDGDIPKMNTGRLITILGAGAVGALAYSFSDSFWFSAVEGEVYAMSSLFTAIVFWAILKWESVVDRGGESRWIIFIAYMVGLSIGVHLLNLLAIPAIAFVYYFKRYKVSIKGLAATAAIAVVVLGVIQGVVIPGTVSYAAKFELLFVNSFGMPFNSGVIVYAILVLGGIVGLLFLSRVKNWPALNTSILSLLMILIGYSTFAMVVVRSSANPPMDENNPENLFTLLSYLLREQYGDRPLLTGQYWNSPQSTDNPTTDGRQNYIPSYSVKTPGIANDRLVKSFRSEFEAEQFVKESGDAQLFVMREYLATNEKKGAIPVYDPAFTTVFPRMYSAQDNHVNDYKTWSNYQDFNTAKGQEKLLEKEKLLSQMESLINYVQQGGQDPRATDQYQYALAQRNKLQEQLQPTFSENWRYFMSYQMGWMYTRYFLWNFAGKQNDAQGHGELLNGNWLSGVKFVDAERLGNRDNLPEHFIQNKGHNRLYFLPLIFGLMGLIFQLVRHKKDFTVVALLFILTGIAVVVYLNQPPQQPRERDYAYVGSFYAFSIWIGLGVCALRYAATQIKTKQLLPILGVAIGLPLFFFIAESVGGSSHAFSYALLWMAGVACVLLLISHFLGKTVKGPATSIIAVGLGMVIPLLMLAEGWDDHNRAKRKTASDFAKNYLDSLDEDAIIFTNGDNDTFPLWYVQEVEGYRTDVRIVNLSLLNTDWYIDQLKRKAYESSPVPFSIEEQKYRQGTRDIVLLEPAVNDSTYTSVSEAVAFSLDDSNNRVLGGGKAYSSLPTDRFSLKVDTEKAKDMLPPQDWDRIVDEVTWTINKQYILKSTFMVLDLLQANNWERPVYFAVTTGRDAYMGMSDYFMLEGLAYRLVPAKFPKSQNPNVIGGINEDAMYDMVMNKFQWGNMDLLEGDGIYMDENNRRMTTNLRLQLSTLADELIAVGQPEKARDILQKTLEAMPEKNVPFDRVMIPIIEGFYAVGDIESADAIAKRLFDKSKAEMEYFFSLDADAQNRIGDEMLMSLSTIANLEQMTSEIYTDSKIGEEITKEFDALETQYRMQEAERVLRGGASF